MWVLCHEHRRSKRHAQLYGREIKEGPSGADPKPPQAAVVKSNGGERYGNVGTMIPVAWSRGRKRKRTI